LKCSRISERNRKKGFSVKSCAKAEQIEKRTSEERKTMKEKDRIADERGLIKA
jgi:hypothetical protein